MSAAGSLSAVVTPHRTALSSSWSSDGYLLHPSLTCSAGDSLVICLRVCGPAFFVLCFLTSSLSVFPSFAVIFSVFFLLTVAKFTGSSCLPPITLCTYKYSHFLLTTVIVFLVLHTGKQISRLSFTIYIAVSGNKLFSEALS